MGVARRLGAIVEIPPFAYLESNPENSGDSAWWVV